MSSTHLPTSSESASAQGIEESPAGGLVMPKGDSLASISVNPSSELLQTLAAEGQHHIVEMLKPESELTAEQRSSLIEQLQSIDWKGFHGNVYEAPNLANVTSADAIHLEDRPAIAAKVEELGRAAYMNGEVAVLLVAGGDGSRLGFDRPKGCFPVGPVSSDSLYQKFAEKVLSISKETGHDVPFVIMTGPSTDRPTREFFAENNFFGLKPQQVIIFQQASLPTVDRDGKLLLKGPGSLLTNPNGHGGTIEGLNSSGALDQLLSRGIQDIVYLQVDNVIAPVFDPFSVGIRRFKRVDIINKVVEKVSAQEKMGAFVRADGKDCVVEYSDLKDQQKTMQTDGGKLLFGLGNVAAHIISTDFLSELRNRHFRLPYHEALKEVQAWNGEFDAEGTPVRVKMQGLKREMFIFDIMPLADCLCVEVSRAQEFAPIKNGQGSDSPDTARALLSAEYHRWCKEAGVELRPDCVLEISPKFASTAEQFAAEVAKSSEIRDLLRAAGTRLYIGAQ